MDGCPVFKIYFEGFCGFKQIAVYSVYQFWDTHENS